MSTLIGEDGRHLIIFIENVHLNTGSTRTVVEAHVAVQASRMLTLSYFRLCLGSADALAVVHTDYLIFISDKR